LGGQAVGPRGPLADDMSNHDASAKRFETAHCRAFSSAEVLSDASRAHFRGIR